MKQIILLSILMLAANILYSQPQLKQYSNDVLKFHYPNSCVLTEKELIPGSQQIYLEDEDITFAISIVKFGNAITDIDLSEFLNSTIDGIKKTMEDVSFSPEIQTKFKGAVCRMVTFKQEVLLIPFYGEVKVIKTNDFIITTTTMSEGHALCSKLKQIEESIEFINDYKSQASSSFSEGSIEEIENRALEGDKGAQIYLGYAYFEGKEVQKNAKKAFFWTKVIANEGYKSSQYMLGMFYEKGVGTDIDIIEAIKWYEKSAKQNYLDAQLSLYKLYKEYQEYEDALNWLMKATNNTNNAKALYYLSQELREGIIISKDEENADFWLKEAYKRGYKD